MRYARNTRVYTNSLLLTRLEENGRIPTLSVPPEEKPKYLRAQHGRITEISLKTVVAGRIKDP